MLRRIAFTGNDVTLLKQAQEAVGDLELEIVSKEPGASFSIGTVALITDAADKSMLEEMSGFGRRQEKVLHLLAMAIDCREGLIPGTSRRLQEHATRFAQATGLDSDAQLTLERAALIHDLGKLRISNDVLLKTSVLTYDEWIEIQNHPLFGAEIIEQTDVFKETADVVRRHHENYDGTGYPDGFEGDEIPYLARVMRVLDAYCAMTSPRLYRKGYACHKTACEHLTKEREKHFDPDVVDAFIQHDIGQTTPPTVESTP